MKLKQDQDLILKGFYMKILNNYYLKSFFFSLLLGCLIIVPGIITGHGILTIMDDFNMQQIPFNEVINESIKNGNIAWTWLNDLGSNFIGTYSFYNLASPFVLLGLLFPADVFPYVVGPVFILKYGVAGLTSYLFLQQYVKDKKWALLGSLLYSFSGFQITNMLFYHFHDVVAFFPLLLYSLDRLVNDNKKILFSLCVALSVFTNYFFFIGEVVFLIIYYLIRVFTKTYNFTFKNFSRIIFEGFLGVGMAMVILLPSLLFVISNPRIDNAWTLGTMLKYDINNYLEIIRALIFPNEVMSFRSVISNSNYNSIDTFLPLVGSIFVFSYVIKNSKKWPSVLFIVCLIFMFIPILNSSFFAFTTSYYARWFYMPILIMSLLTIKCLDENVDIKYGLYITLGLFVVFGLLLSYSYFIENQQILYNKTFFIVYLLLFIFCFIYVLSVNRKKNRYILLIIGIFIYVIFRGNYFIYQNKNTLGNTLEMQNYLFNSNQIKIEEKDIRTDSSSTCLRNMSYLLDVPNLRSFNSNLQGSNFEFYNSIGFVRVVNTLFADNEVNLRNFLSVKYVFSCNKPNKVLDENFKFLKSTKNFYIYENMNYKKMGISYNYYISKKDFEKYDDETKRRLLNEAIILNEKQIEKYGNKLNKYKEGKNDYLNNLDKNDFKFDSSKFLSKITSSKDSLILYTVPYDNGWTAKLNGKKVKIEKVDNGLMAIKIYKGANNIEFNYEVPGLKLGRLISTISIVILVIYFCFERKFKKV